MNDSLPQGTDRISDDGSESHRRVRFVVTGFGPFQGVPNNPTTVIVGKLPAFLQEREASSDDGSNVVKLSGMMTTRIMETSAAAVRQTVDEFFDKEQQQQPPTNDAQESDKGVYGGQREPILILLHLGVNYRGTGFALETCAYNDASFRIPDERGFRPDQQTVVDERAFGETLETTLDIPSLVNVLNSQNFTMETDDDDGNKNGCSPCKTDSEPTTTADKEQPSLSLVKPSTDPGRFVCNYTYCYSLNKFQCDRSSALFSNENGGRDRNHCCNNNTKCLFVHVPPFSVIREKEQLVFVSRLMMALYDQVTGSMEAQTIA